MIKGRTIIAGLFIFALATVTYGQNTYFPQCYKHYPNEKVFNTLLEDLYLDATGYVSNGDIESLEFSLVQMSSIADTDNPLNMGLLETLEGIIGYFKGDKAIALEHFLKALAIYSNEEFYQGINTLYNNIAIIFALVGDHQSSEEYLKRAIEINEEEDLDYYGLFTYNLANVEIELGNYEEAVEIFKELLRDSDISLEPVSPVSIIGSIIGAYNKLGKKEEAENWINRGYLAMDESRHGEIDKLTFYTSVMEYHLNNGDYEKVISTSTGYGIDERLILPDQYDHIKYLCKAYSETGNYEKAWEYIDILNEIISEDNIVNREEIITLLMVEYEVSRNQRMKESVEQEMILNKTKQAAVHRLMVTFLIVLVILLILFIIMLRIRKIRNKYKEEFSIETEKFATVNRELQKTNKELEKENRLLDTLISVFAHDLINPFQAILGFSRLMVDDFESLDKKSIAEYSSMLSETSFHLNQLLTNLKSIATLQEGKQKLEPSNVRVSDHVEDVVKLYKPLAEKKNIFFNTRLNSKHIVKINPEIFQSVLRNVINNALKYSNQDGEVRIYSDDKGEYIKLAIEDDGIGMDEEIVNNILNGNYLISQPGTKSEKGSGLGLTICIELLEINNGRLEIDNSRDKGTSIILKIPAANA